MDPFLVLTKKKKKKKGDCKADAQTLMITLR